MRKSSAKKHLLFRYRRRPRTIIIFALILTCLILADRLGLISSPPGTDRQRYHDKVFNVLKVVDGDTLDLDIPDPTTGKSFTRVRLWGVDTPETKHPTRGQMYFGPEASDFTKKLALNQKVRVSLEPYENTRGKFGRLLAYIFLPDDTMLNEQLIENGYGYADPRFKHILRQKFLQLQQQAKKEKLGLWQNVTPDQFPPWYRRRHQPPETPG